MYLHLPDMPCSNTADLNAHEHEVAKADKGAAERDRQLNDDALERAATYHDDPGLRIRLLEGVANDDAFTAAFYALCGEILGTPDKEAAIVTADFRAHVEAVAVDYFKPQIEELER